MKTPNITNFRLDSRTHEWRPGGRSERETLRPCKDVMEQRGDNPGHQGWHWFWMFRLWPHTCLWICHSDIRILGLKFAHYKDRKPEGADDVFSGIWALILVSNVYWGGRHICDEWWAWWFGVFLGLLGLWGAVMMSSHTINIYLLLQVENSAIGQNP